jgi:hypothetical protein
MNKTEYEVKLLSKPEGTYTTAKTTRVMLSMIIMTGVNALLYPGPEPNLDPQISMKNINREVE